MVASLFEKYLNIREYYMHPLYRAAHADAIANADKKGVEDSIYEGYVIGYEKGYIETTFKLAIGNIKSQLKEDVLELANIEKYYELRREDVLYLLKQILNNNL